MSYQVLLFDLFGTVVHFAASVPTIAAAGERRRSTLGWLESTVAEELPGVAFADFLAAVFAVTREIVAGRAPDHLEVSSPERFRRALDKLGVAPDEAARLGPELSAVHMKHLAAQTVLPPGHRETLESLQGRYRMGIVSNFDHGPTARAILAQHGVAEFFETIIVSDGFGRRKPHPSIFQHAVAAFAVRPQEALFIGDSLEDDVAGARAAGLAVVWIGDRSELDGRGEVARPDHCIRVFTELGELLD